MLRVRKWRKDFLSRESSTNCILFAERLLVVHVTGNKEVSTYGTSSSGIQPQACSTRSESMHSGRDPRPTLGKTMKTIKAAGRWLGGWPPSGYSVSGSHPSAKLRAITFENIRNVHVAPVEVDMATTPMTGLLPGACTRYDSKYTWMP